MTPFDTSAVNFDTAERSPNVPLRYRGAPSPIPESDKTRSIAGIDSPAALRALPRSRLKKIVRELRQEVLESVASTGGHLSSNLGSVELAVALHYVLDTPHDRLIWDVGHQCYPHKILTGRRHAMKQLRVAGGISGFPRRTESTYDAFGTAHSSTSISAGLGMAVAARTMHAPRRVVAVIGDGAMSAGMVYEALNNAASSGANMLIVLNDNEMSISPSVGALLRHLAQLSGDRRRALESHRWRTQLRRPSRAPALDTEVPPPGRSLFEALGVAYHGPIDGHDVDALVTEIGALLDLPGVHVLHALTRKGQGYAPAEAEPTRYHGVSKFTPGCGLPTSAGAAPASFTKTFGDWLCDRAVRDPAMIAITPAMIDGSGMVAFAGAFPDRCFDVGIAEQHAVTFAAGLACEGAKPVVAIYSTFLQRAFDQFVHDVQLQDLPVLFAIDRAGLVGADGATHHGAFDLSYLRCVPNLTLMTPASEAECHAMLEFGAELGKPAAVRYPRGASGDSNAAAPCPPIDGRGVCVRRGRRAALLAFGPLLHAAAEAGVALDLTVANMRFVKPLDEALVLELAREHELLVTIEDNVVAGGAGSAVLECLAKHAMVRPLLQLGLPDRFVDHGDQRELLAALGLNAAGIAAAVRQRLDFGTVMRESIA